MITVARRTSMTSGVDSHDGLWLTNSFGGRLTVRNGGVVTRRTGSMIDLTRYLPPHSPRAVREHTFKGTCICFAGSTRGLRISNWQHAEQVSQGTSGIARTSVPDLYGVHGLWW